MVARSLFFSRRSKSILAALTLTALAAACTGSALAQQQAIYAPGEPVVTGFSGVAPPGTPPPAGNPIDTTFIDLDGASMIIQQLKPNGPPTGQVIDAPTVFSAKARDVGQVFGVALDDSAVPNIYVSATSAYGLDIVVPGSDGNPVRSKVGATNASFMSGLWGSAGNAQGGPGSIWKVDGTTGAISLFATIPGNSGAGLGDIVFDPTTEQFFVSDLDNGLIYRIGLDGQVIDSFDHGIAGRPTHGLAAIADDGSEIDVTNPSFNSEDPATWGFTQAARKVYGLAVHSGRLYYAAAEGPEIWSIGIAADGGFAGDPRWELDVTGLPSTNEVSNIAFDPEGRMILAQRGPQVGSYDYSVFAQPVTSSVVRYTREVPDDPSTPSTWIETLDSYAIGFKPNGENATGGIALGYGYDPVRQELSGACGDFLWSTGEQLSNDTAVSSVGANPPTHVEGLQGNDHELVRPQNDPPFQSYFTQYDGKPGVATDAGHIGAVAIWQQCTGGSSAYVPPYAPPPGFVPPPPNLTLHKFGIGRECYETRDGWRCDFDLRVSNSGGGIYWGPLTIDDQLPAPPPGVRLAFGASGPWQCAETGPGAAECSLPDVVLYPGESTDVRVGVLLPPKTNLCIVDNAGQIVWRDGRGNTGRDQDFASLRLPVRQCPPPPPPGGKTNLKLTKTAFPQTCTAVTAGWSCTYLIDVQNTGPGVYNAPIEVKDQFGAPAALAGAPAPWACTQAGTQLTCDRPTTLLIPGQHVLLGVRAIIPAANVERQKLCSVRDVAKITKAPGGSSLNTNPGDDTGSATSVIPARGCANPGRTDLSLTKIGYRCEPVARLALGGPGSAFQCIYEVVIKNQGPGNFAGPLAFTDHFSPAVSGITTGPGVSCAATGGGFDCASTASVSLTPGQSVGYLIAGNVTGRDICRLANTAHLTSPPGGSALNTNPANDTGSAVLAVPDPACNAQPGRLTITKTPGTCTASPAAGPQVLDCTFTVTVHNGGSGPVAGPIVVKDTPAGSASLSIGSGTCTGNNAAGTCTYGGALTSGNSFGFAVTEHVARRAALDADCRIGNGAAIVTPAGGPSANATDLVPVSLCQPKAPPPQISTPTVPPVVVPPRLCPSDSTGRYPDCVCRPGTHGTPGACITRRPPPPPPGRLCPKGSVGTFPDCVCPPGTHGRPGACLPDRPTPPKLCPRDSTGPYPDCICRRGTHGTPGNCVPDRPIPPPVVRLCPRGTVGVYPDCRCPRGTIGRPPRCEVIQPIPGGILHPGLLNPGFEGRTPLR